jgi:glycosyltransferase involved in cell wall biosynthesis
MTTQAVRVLELRSVRGTGGGPEKTILMGAAMADPARAQVTVCYLRDARDTVFGMDQRAASAGVDYVEIPERHSFDPTVWPQLRRLVRDRGIDLVHAHDYKTDVLALLLAKSCGIAALSTVHGWTGHSARERLCYYPADKKVLSRFSRLIAVSSEIGRELTRYGADPARITTVLNGIDPRQFRRDESQVQTARAALGLHADEVAIGAVGRLEPQKRFDLLLEAFAVVHARRPNTRLFIVGDGSQRDPLDAQIRALGLTESCTLVGHTNDVRPSYHAFDLFVQASDYEGTPNAVLEAMALETPIVATDAGGTAELLHDGVHGRIVPTGRVDRLIHGMEEALADRGGARKMADRARLRVEGELSFEARVRRVEGIYAEMMGHA